MLRPRKLDVRRAQQVCVPVHNRDPGLIREHPWAKELPLTPPPECFHPAAVSDQTQTPLQQTLHWLTAHAGFPARRLPDKAELLLLIATAAANEDLEARNPQNAKIPFNANYNAQIRNYTAQRRRAHIKCDNSAKT